MNEFSPRGEQTLSIRVSSALGLNRNFRKAPLLRRSIPILTIILIYGIFHVINTNSNNIHDRDSHIHQPRRLLNFLSRSGTLGNYDIQPHSGQDTVQPQKTIEASKNCTNSALLEFPWDGFTRDQRGHGWIILHILLVLYCFWFLAMICEDYFVPSIEQMCAGLSVEKDIIGATFMAAATSSPELFMNCVGTFIAKGDIGVSAIMGSAVFNILAVPACCGLFVGQCIRLDWWPVSRDCLAYCSAVLALIAILYDGRIMWYEGLALIVGYFLYMIVMFYNKNIAKFVKNLLSTSRRKFCKGGYHFREVTEFSPLLRKSFHLQKNLTEYHRFHVVAPGGSTESIDPEKAVDVSNSLNTWTRNGSEFADNPWQRSGRCSLKYLLQWPITLILWVTVPDSRQRPGWKYVTFGLAISWIGAISYIAAFLITIIGDTLNIPDSVIGLTILAAGMSVPEAVSSIIVTKQGDGAMGISNSIGSNTFDILLGLGIPWTIKAYFLAEVSEERWFTLNSKGLTYSTAFLLSTLLGLYIAFVLNRFVLDWRIGVACTMMYIAFLIIASMVELNIFFPVNLPVCGREY